MTIHHLPEAGSKARIDCDYFAPASVRYCLRLTDGEIRVADATHPEPLYKLSEQYRLALQEGPLE